MMITGASVRHLAHIGLDDALALIVESARRLVEDQDAPAGSQALSAMAMRWR